eukprot:scaffold295761_cov33-Prasinocladus_malaysianus.AAC.1
MRLICKSHPGLLRDLTMELKALSINVLSVDLSSDRITSSYKMVLSDNLGSPLSPLLMTLVSTSLRGEPPSELLA